MAAVLVVAVLGTEVVRLNNRIDELETKTANVISQNNAQNNVYAGIKSGAKLGDYESASDYGKLYDVAKKAEASIRNTASGDLLESAEQQELRLMHRLQISRRRQPKQSIQPPT